MTRPENFLPSISSVSWKIKRNPSRNGTWVNRKSAICISDHVNKSKTTTWHVVNAIATNLHELLLFRNHVSSTIAASQYFKIMRVYQNNAMDIFQSFTQSLYLHIKIVVQLHNFTGLLVVVAGQSARQYNFLFCQF